jgi:GcrA cell cycle regulator
MSEVVKLEDLNHNMCKWPIGDPKDNDFHFCGCKSEPGHSYCEHHTAMAYRTTGGGRISTEESKKAA